MFPGSRLFLVQQLQLLLRAAASQQEPWEALHARQQHTPLPCTVSHIHPNAAEDAHAVSSYLQDKMHVLPSSLR